jgi:hypothetical protein
MINMKNLIKNFTVSRYWIVTILFVTAKLLIHFLTNERYELLRDEMLFFNMGEHLSAGYATVPPVTGFLAFLANKIFGFSVLGIRFFPALMGAASIYIIAAIVRELGGGITALCIAASSYLLAPGFLIVNTLFTPNAAEELIWLLLMWYIFRMVRSGNSRLWIPVGILIGIGFLNKYSVLFPVAGFLVALLFTENRKLFASKYFLLSLCTGLVIISPNIVWQYNHCWPVIIHMSELRSSQLDLMGYFAFPVSLFAFCQGSAIIWLTGLTALLFSSAERQYRYLGVASVTIFLLFLLGKGKGYYALGAIPFLLAFGGYVFEKYLTGRFRIAGFTIFSVLLLMSVAAMPSGLPVLSFENYSKYIQKTQKFIFHPLLEWDNGEKHDFSQAWADMTGWKELAGYVAKAYYTLTEEERKKCTIFGERNYGYAGAVYFYGKEYNLPEAITFHESYVFWAPDTIPAGPIIYICRDINDLEKYFGNISLAGSVDNKFFREKGLEVFLCREPLPEIAKVYKDLAMREKSRYRRKADYLRLSDCNSPVSGVLNFEAFFLVSKVNFSAKKQPGVSFLNIPDVI